MNASTTTAGTGGTGGSGSAGTGGQGATPGGGGWLSPGGNYNSGASCTVKCSGNSLGVTVGGASPTTAIVYHGCSSTSDTGDGGFGGASGGSGNCTSSFGGGGGGGYSGGVGQSGSSAGGGGGGSYNGGINQVNQAAYGTGNGKVIITELCSIGLTAFGNTVSPMICNGQNVTLTTDAVSNYSWSTGVTGTNQIVVSPSANTVVTVYGTSTANCTASRNMTIIVSQASPTVNLSVTSNSICLGDSVSISGGNS